MTKSNHTRRTFITTGAIASAVVAASGIGSVAHAGAAVTPELAQLATDLNAARERAAEVEATGDEAAAESAYDVCNGLEQQIEAFPVRTAGDLVVLAELAQQQMADGGLTFVMPDALVTGILRLFGKVGA